MSDSREMVVKLRETGMTYQAVADKRGITRERVRQILHEMGRSDLCHRKWNRRKIDRGNCKQCGASLEGKPCHTVEFCNKDCWSDYCQSTPTPYEATIFEKARAMRNQHPPVKWREIGDYFGLSPQGAFNIWKRAAKKLERASK